MRTSGAADGSPSGAEPGGSSRWAALLAGSLYLAVALWELRAVLPAPASTFPYPERAVTEAPRWGRVIRSDQKLTAALVTHNARSILTDPARLMDGGQCYPVPKAVTLGEHMFGQGLLGVLPYLLTHDPIVTYNVVVGLGWWIAAMAMYALVFFWTGSAGAAIVAGLVFGFHPLRFGNVEHPYVLADEWTPLALLFAHRLFARRRWMDAVGLGLCVGLQLLESIYPVLALAILGAVYGMYLMARHWRALPALAPKLLLAGAMVTGVAVMVLGPYLQTRALWGTLTGRATLLSQPVDFGIGRAGYPGSVLLVLAVIALVDRVVHGARRMDGYDPRLVYGVAAGAVAWAALADITVPFWGLRVPSLFTLAGAILPGLDAIRGGAAVRSGVYLVGAFLAGYGVVVVLEWCRGRGRALVVASLVAAVLVEVFWSTVATRSFGASVAMRPYNVRPSAQLLALYENMADGAVLDLPFDMGFGGFFAMGDYMFLGAFHAHRVAACYNSFHLPVQVDIQELAKRLPRDPQAADALAALGIENAVVHRLALPKAAPVFVPTDAPHLTAVGPPGLWMLYRINGSTAVTASFAPLAAASARSPVLEARPPESTLSLTFANGTMTTYRHPDPIIPTAIVARWYDAAGALAGEHARSLLLPLALAAGDQMVRRLTLPVPAAPGTYRLTVAPAATPDLIIASATVRVAVPTSGGG